MVTFSKLSRAELEEMAQGQYRRAFPDGPPQRVPRHRNIGPTLHVLDAERIEIDFRGRRYELLPVSFSDGVRLIRARIAVEELDSETAPTESDVEAYTEALRTVVGLAGCYLVPRRPVRRLLWRLGLTRNPARRATEAEVARLLGFFLGCRMRSSVRYPGT